MSFGLSIAGGNKVKLTVHMGKIVSLKLSKKTKQQIMYFLAGHRNYSFVLTKASAVDKCNKAELSELSVRYEKWTQAVSDYDDYK